MTAASPYILFRDDKSGEVLLFDQPRDIVKAVRAEEVRPALQRLEAAKAEGYWLAGYLSYEAGFVFEDKLRPLIENGRETPLLLFGIFDRPRGKDHPLAILPTPRTGEVLSRPRAGWDFAAYRQAFAELHRHLRQGDCYQGNLTMPVTAEANGTAREIFSALIERQPVRYGALAELGGPAIVSRSPELFFKVDKEGFIETHPMKGTARRGASAREDEAIKAQLLCDEKTQAENRMIVDLLRNDISRLIEVGSLDVPKLFHIETYPTVHQLVSHVRGTLLPGVTLETIIEALFPCGSVTGAPKMWAMQILHRLEKGPRDIYCGAIGFCDPSGPMRFSVAIRTLSLFKTGEAVFNVGGGIVFDSTAEAEYEECLLKARFAVGEQWISR
ncbi:aminodeoxychorismate synthase component I [Allorhizobium undicola]|uniref:aminodeoxychorismate synthase component I n=1 Tax=Allorhizobium undicola TaxID=78527 RepID=UPI000486BBFA|nr:aminodeoxychorismate synthase component I [Allorhizobium undicola]